jgi:DNA-directed RNA polymerase subunit E'/Rpb7
MLQTITQKISIEAMYLNTDIETHIFNKLKKIMEGRCTFDDGYIISVKRLIRIESNTIACANSLVVFEVTYERDVLKPEKGQIFSGKVCMVFQHGIFVDIYEKMKVLVPAKSMHGYYYNEDENKFMGEDKVIESGLEISIDIVMTKYEKKEYNCIGKLHGTNSDEEESN